MSDYIVRYGAMRFLGVFSAPAGQSFNRGMQVIARTERGLEAGEILSEATGELVAQLIDPPSGQILRLMSPEDAIELSRIEEHAHKELDICQRYVDKLELQMDLVSVERIFGGERIVVYYLAENRVDFRELVRLLAGEFQTRIEMRQIGVRDEAKLLADFGDCGCPVCCNSHLVQIPPVSMRMAKLQKATLDPTKISGRCGRLKCCLRYEFDVYEDMRKTFPPVGSVVITPEGRGKVIGQEILGRQLQVLTDDHRRIVVSLAQVELDHSAAPESPEIVEDDQPE
ncbi:MAG: PSP1 domain-containing protein [Thermoguttaceae bacterium]